MKTTLSSVLILLLACVSARADQRTDAQQHFVKGKRAYELGAFDESVAEFSAAYRLQDDPAVLFNLGQAYRLSNHPADALRAYRMYLIRVPDAANRDDVEHKIADVQRQIDENNKRKLAPTTPPSAPQVVVAPAAKAIDFAAPRRKTIAGGALVGAAGAFAIAGVVCGVLAQHNSDTLSRLAQTMQPYDSGLQRAGMTEQVLEGVFIGVGAAAIVTGSALLIAGHRERERARRLAFVPVIAAGGARASLIGSF